MDELLQDKLNDIRNLILETIFDNDTKKINIWKKNGEIDFDKETFSVLFFGDWNRSRYTKLNLDKFINTKNKPSEIFKEIANELQRNKIEGSYKCNFNPNLFFLFYDKFYSLELIHKKNKMYKLSYDLLRDDNDKILGIQILNREKLEDMWILRKEIIRIIEIHSKILFNENLKEYIGLDLFKKIFIKNCVIQKEIQTYYNSRFIDLCYCIDKVFLKPNHEISINELYQIEKKNIYVEINEEHHNSDADKVRNNSLISSAGAVIIPFDVSDIFDQDGIKINNRIITNLCKILIREDKYKNDIMKLYLTEIEKLDEQFVNFIVNYKYKNNKFTIDSIFNIINQNDEDINKEKIIRILFKRGFFNSSEYFVDHNEYHKIKSDGIEYLEVNYKSITMTRLGTENLFYSIDKKFWKNKDNFVQFKIDIEEKYLNSIEKLLSDETLDILIEENNLKNSVFYVLKNFDKEKFYENIKRFSKYKNEFNSEIPFIVKSNKHVIDSRIIKLLISDKLYEEYEETNKFKKECLIGWRFLFESEIKEIMNLPNFLD
jgi:hypothetical protein